MKYIQMFNEFKSLQDKYESMPASEKEGEGGMLLRKRMLDLLVEIKVYESSIERYTLDVEKYKKPFFC